MQAAFLSLPAENLKVLHFLDTMFSVTELMRLSLTYTPKNTDVDTIPTSTPGINLKGKTCDLCICSLQALSYNTYKFD